VWTAASRKKNKTKKQKKKKKTLPDSVFQFVGHFYLFRTRRGFGLFVRRGVMDISCFYFIA
jgi:hypothetical protein